MGEGVDTMFHTLDRYLEEGYIEKYPNVIIYTPDHVLTYRIFAAASRVISNVCPSQERT